MSLINLGNKESMGGVATPSSKSRIYYPSLYIDKAAPVSGKDIGKTVTATVQLKLRGINESQDDQKKRYSCNFDVISIDFGKKLNLKSSSKADLDVAERKEYDRMKK